MVEDNAMSQPRQRSDSQRDGFSGGGRVENSSDVVARTIEARRQFFAARNRNTTDAKVTCVQPVLPVDRAQPAPASVAQTHALPQEPITEPRRDVVHNVPPTTTARATNFDTVLDDLLKPSEEIVVPIAINVPKVRRTEPTAELSKKVVTKPHTGRSHAPQQRPESQRPQQQSQGTPRLHPKPQARELTSKQQWIREQEAMSAYFPPAVYQLGKAYDSDEVPMAHVADLYTQTATQENIVPAQHLEDVATNFYDHTPHKDADTFNIRDLFLAGTERITPLHRVSVHFSFVSMFALLVAGSFVFAGHALAVRTKVMDSADEAATALRAALTHAQEANVDGARGALADAQTHLGNAKNDLETIGGFAIAASQFVPGISKLASGDGLIDAGLALTRGADALAAIAQDTLALQDQFTTENEHKPSLLEYVGRTFEHVANAQQAFEEARDDIDRVRADDVPQEVRDQFLHLQRALPGIDNTLGETLALKDPIENFFGKNGPQKFLFLFSNNQEMRATGGFIGSYARMDMSDGHVSEFFIDGIYNPDGQLDDKIVPPLPIQKISAAWSLHDSNWWPDFPVSARKAMDFYERTGGPSVDGVVMVTPTVVEKLLNLTGPLEMEEYGVTLTAENFVELTQYKVEEDYDEEENRPKKILSDMMPQLIEKLTNDITAKKALALMNIMTESLDERHVMFYMKDQHLQAIIEEHGWGGRIIDTQYDYLSVINSNINGFKTDGVIDETIDHEVAIGRDGRILDTVTITREHTGGYTGRAWWDTVNSNYMRVYVPEGSQLIDVEGHTYEINKPRLNYGELGFLVDADVAAEENNMKVLTDSSTRVYDQFGKTVFANWVYVSPGETVRVKYTYELPWRITYGSDTDGLFGAYGAFYQKQAGSVNTHLNSVIRFPDGAQKVWSSPEIAPAPQLTDMTLSQPLTKDAYQGVVYRIK